MFEIPFWSRYIFIGSRVTSPFSLCTYYQFYSALKNLVLWARIRICSIKRGGNKKWDITAETQRTQREPFFPLPLRGRPRKSTVFPKGCSFCFSASHRKTKIQFSLRSPRLCGENRNQNAWHPFMLDFTENNAIRKL